MKETRILMDMPVKVEVVDPAVTKQTLDEVFNYFIYVDNTFSTFKKNSEMSQINQGKLKKDQWSRDMKTVIDLCRETEKETLGYFNYHVNEQYDPLGLVKGWAINNAAKLLRTKGFKNFYVEAGGDIQVSGKNKLNQNWRIGIQNPFNLKQNVKIVELDRQGIATSGTYKRGQHIRNPFSPERLTDGIVSLTVIGPDIYEADRFATAAFAMGKKGIEFIAGLTGIEGYMIDDQGLAVFTKGFNNYTLNNGKTN